MFLEVKVGSLSRSDEYVFITSPVINDQSWSNEKMGHT